MKELISLFLISAILATPIKVLLGGYSKLDVLTKTFSVGTPPVEGEFCFSMLSNTNWVRSKDCSACVKFGQYSCSASSTCTAQSASEITTDSYSLKGTMVTDTIDFSSFRFDLPFLEVTEESGSAPEFDGCIALGLSSYSQPTHLIKMLKEANTIEQAVVGIDFEQKKDSTIMFGGYDTIYVKKPKNIKWFDVTDEWSFPVVDIELHGFHSGSTKVKLLMDYDSIVVPSSSYDSIMSTIKSNKPCFYNQCTVTESSFISMPSIKIKVDDKTTWKIDYRYYTKEISRFTKLSYCDRNGCHYITYIVFETTFAKGDSYWGLGGEGLQHFYSIFDYDQAKLGMYYKGMPANAKRILYIVLGSVFGGLVLIGVIIIIVCRCR